MIKQFFFGTTDSPIYMFHHALGSVLILIFTCFLIAIIINWISTRRKGKSKIASEKFIQKEKPSIVSEIIQEEKISIAPKTIEEIKEEIKTTTIATGSQEILIKETKQVSEENKFVVEDFENAICNLKDHLFLFTEILLNKKLTEQDWDKRIPETASLDHRNYHRLIFLLINLNIDIEQTTSRFKLVLETTNEVAINHQIYFRNWMMPSEMISSFKSGNDFAHDSSRDKKEICMAVKIAETKNWKLQASSSEQGTMINLLMKLSIKKETTNI